VHHFKRIEVWENKKLHRLQLRPKLMELKKKAAIIHAIQTAAMRAAEHHKITASLI